MKLSPLSILLVLVMVLASCSSDVQDKNKDVEDKTIVVNSISKTNTIINRAFLGSDTITSKTFNIKTCLVESALGQKIDLQMVEVSGDINFTKQTDPDGCIDWDQEIQFDYSGENLCHVFSLDIRLQDTNYRTTANYSIDILDNELSDLSRSKGCMEKRTGLTNFRRNNQDVGDPELQLGELNFEYIGTTTQRRSDVRYTSYESGIGSCLTNQIDNKPIRGQLTIIIDDPDGTNEKLEMPTETDEKGCFRLTYNSRYEQYKYAHWKKKNITIRLDSGPFEGKQISRDYYVNPWLEGTKFGFDSIYQNVPPQNAVEQWNRVHIDQVMYVRVGNNISEFDVNNYLGLTTSKTYQIVLSPKVDRGHYFSNRAGQYVELPDGPFRMRFMLLAPKGTDINITEENFENFEYITGVEEIVEVKNGYIQAFVNLPMRFADLPKIAVRTVSVFQLEPVNNTGLIGTTVTGFFKAKINWIRSSVVQSDVLQTDTQILEERVAENYTPTQHERQRKQAERSIDRMIEELDEQLRRGEIDLDLIHDRYSPQLQSKSSSLEDAALKDLRNFQFKKYVEELLRRTDESYKSGGYHNPVEVFNGKTPKEIYQADMLHNKPESLHFKLGSEILGQEDNGEVKYSDRVKARKQKITSLQQELSKLDPNLMKDEEFTSEQERIRTEMEAITNEHLNDYNYLAISPSLFNSVYDNGIPLDSNSQNRDFFKKLCRIIFPVKYIHGNAEDKGFLAWLSRKKDNYNEGDYRSCWRKPALKLKMTALRHTNRVKKVMPRFSSSFDFSIGSRVYASYSTNYSTYNSIRNAIDLAGKVPFGDLLTQGIRIFDVSQTVSSGEQDTTSWSDDVSTHLNIGVEKFNIGLQGEFERCMQIEVKPFIKTAVMSNVNMGISFRDMIPDIQNIVGGQVNSEIDDYSIYDDPKYDPYRTTIPTTYHICNTPMEEEISEEWFFTQTYTPDTSLLSDSMGPTEIKFIKAIRGRKNFEEYKNAFEDHTKHYLYVDTSSSETPDIKLYQRWGHIVKTQNDPSAENKLQIKNITRTIYNNIEGSYPGTFIRN